MRSLNTSLPVASSPRRQQPQPPEQLLQVFKQAALSVTNLYKAAASQHDKVYREGYQEALEELLGFLDKENLGLQDGEGWRVRQWATERFNGTTNAAGLNPGESDEETEQEKRARSSSPSLQRKASQDLLKQHIHHAIPETSSHTRSESAPPIVAATTATNSPTRENMHIYTVPQSEFTFQSSHQFPSVRDIEMDTVDNNGSTVHVNIHPRSTRTARQNNRQVNRNGSSLGPGAGVKRRLQNFDFFDLGGFNGKDGSGGGGGGGKRGRFT